MKIKRFIKLGLLSILVLGCSSSKKAVVANSEIDQMMALKAFEISIITAEPMVTQAMTQVATSGILPPGDTMGRIDVTGDGFFIKVKGDSVSANLPYFGERQMGGGFGSPNGIVFDGIAKDQIIDKDAIKQRYEVNFKINSSSEAFFINIMIGNSGTSTTAVRSSQRNRIRYSGKVHTIE